MRFVSMIVGLSPLNTNCWLDESPWAQWRAVKYKLFMWHTSLGFISTKLACYNIFNSMNHLWLLNRADQKKQQQQARVNWVKQIKPSSGFLLLLDKCHRRILWRTFAFSNINSHSRLFTCAARVFFRLMIATSNISAWVIISGGGIDFFSTFFSRCVSISVTGNW